MTKHNHTFEENENLVYHILKNNIYHARNITREDLEQEGFLGLIIALENFDTTKNIKFSTFACNCIRWKVLDLVNKNSRSKSRIPDWLVHNFCNPEDDDPVSVSEWIDQKSETPRKIAIRNEFFARLNKESDEIKEFAYDIIIEGRTNTELAEKYGVTHQAISQRKAKAIEHLKHLYKGRLSDG